MVQDAPRFLVYVESVDKGEQKGLLYPLQRPVSESDYAGQNEM